jgi:hypothetical protein
MSSKTCTSCQKKAGDIVCGCCHESVCKNCAQFTTDEQFSYLAQKPKFLTANAFCQVCFSNQVLPIIEAYETTMNQAKEIAVFGKTQTKETRFISRKEKPFTIVDCADYEEAVLRLAFFAASKQFNALIDLDLKSKKVRIGSYQTTVWSGSAIPANVEARRLVKDRSIWQNPN